MKILDLTLQDITTFEALTDHEDLENWMGSNMGSGLYLSVSSNNVVMFEQNYDKDVPEETKELLHIELFKNDGAPGKYEQC